MKRLSSALRDFAISATRFWADFSPMRSRPSSVGVEFVQIGGIGHKAALDELVDDLLAQPLDVHRAPRREVQQRLLALRLAVEAAGAARGRLALARARRASRRPGIPAASRSARCGPLLAHPDHLGNHVAGAAHDHRVAHPARPCARSSSSLCRVALVTVTPPTKTGFNLATGVRDAGSSYLDLNLKNFGCLLLRGILAGDRPARLARDVSQAALQLEAVHLVDHAVDVERQLRASGDLAGSIA